MEENNKKRKRFSDKKRKELMELNHDEIIRLYHCDNKNIKEIAVLLNLNNDMVRECLRLNGSFVKFSDTHGMEVLRLFGEEDMDTGQIAQVFNICRSEIVRCLREYGVFTTTSKRYGDEIEKMYKKGIKVIDIANYFNVSENPIQKHLRKMGLLPDFYLSQEIIDKIVEMYNNGVSSHEIKRTLGLTRNTVMKYVKKNCKVRTLSECNKIYNFNENVFDDLSPESFYWIGAIASDGCVHYYNDGRMPTISLSSADEDWIKQFSDFIGDNVPPYSKSQNTWALSLSSNKMASSLENYGIGPRKSLTLCPRDVPENMLSHFVRGMFDGDGHIRILGKDVKNRTNHPGCFMDITSASGKFVEWFKSIVPVSLSGISITEPNGKKIKNTLYSIRYEYTKYGLL